MSDPGPTPRAPGDPTAAMIGYGTLVSIHDGATPGVFVELEEIYSVTPPNQQVDQVEATHNASPNRTREFIPGLISPGECSFEMNFIPGSDSDVMLTALKAAGTNNQVKVTFPNLVTWEFLASVTGYEPSSPTDDRMTVTVTLTVSGSTTITVPPP